MIITFISDTHWKHREVTQDIPIGDVLIHAGDFTGRGYKHEVEQFCRWFDDIQYYNHKFFISGNHELGFEDYPEDTMKVVNFYKNIKYLQDEEYVFGHEHDEGLVKVYGTPWQPEFNNWAFNLPRNGDELEAKWKMIPVDTDILVTHCPPFGVLDYNRGMNLGCELLIDYAKEVIKPKIHVFGHIHTGYGYYFDGTTHFINATVLNDHYQYTNKPLTIDWDAKTNKLMFLKN